MMYPALLCAAVVAAGIPLMADDDADRKKIDGAWEVQSGAGGSGPAEWTFASKDDGIHIVRSEAGQKNADYQCNTSGKECKVKDDGREAKVSLWYSGPKLVEIETKGSTVVKRRFSAAGDDTLTMEVIPVVPQGKPETLKLVRKSESASAASR